jgi:uncharacterized tellurite resistance protein B-like protein
MPLSVLRKFLGVADDERAEPSALRDLIDSLDALEPQQGRQLARFAYLLGRVALADRQASDDETRTMERLVVELAGVTSDQATVVVGLAKNSNRLFGGTADFEVARDFSDAASYEEKLALAKCLFTVAAADRSISLQEESEIHRVLNQLKILPQDLRTLRASHARLLPGMTPAPSAE